MSGRLFGRTARAIITLPEGQNFETGSLGPFLNSVVLEAAGAARNTLTIDASDDTGRPGLRIQFKITKTSQKDPNDAELTITNLNPAHRAQLQLKGLRISLDAGYQQTGMQRIFLGDSRTTDQIRDGADWNTTIRMGDGTRALKYKRFSSCWKDPVTVGDVLTDLASQSGLAVGNTGDVAPKLQKLFQHGYSVNGPVSESIDRLLKSVGYGWSVQYGTLYVLAPGGFLSGPSTEISPESGLIDSPEMGSPEKKGGPRLIKFKSLLFPANPGATVKLRSERYNAVLRIKKSELEGDTAGGAWYTTVLGEVISSTANNPNDQAVG